MQTLDFVAPDGFALKGRLFPAVGTAKAGIIINSATAVRCTFYYAFAEHLAEHGYTVICYDYRGVGGSQPQPHSESAAALSMRAWGELDFETVIQWAFNAYPTLSWHCIGHSVGGQLVGLAASNHKLSSIYCVASQNGYWKNWGWLQQPKLLLLWYVVIPLLSKLLGFLPGFVLGGESLPGPIIQEWARWCTTPDFITDAQGYPLRDGFMRYDKKMRFVVISDDLDFAPRKAVKALQALFISADTELDDIEPQVFGLKEIGHFGFFKHQNKDALWHNTIDWLAQFS